MSLGKKFTYTGIGLMAAAILFTVMVAGIDVRPIAPDGSLVGMGGLNIAFAEAFFSDVPGVYTINRVLYGISEFGGILALVTAAAFGVLGVYQIIKRKKIFKVDYCVLSMGVLYVIVGILYVVFDKFAVNMRPVFEANGTLESSFPSSHTLLACCIFVPAIFAIGRVIEDRRISFVLSTIMAFLAVVVVICRLFCGVHWLTDMIGGLLYSAALVSVYIGANLIYEFK